MPVYRALSGKAKRHKNTRVALVFNALADDLSRGLFKLIADVSGTKDATGSKLMATSKLTRKMFYSRLSALKQAGLIRKRDNEYYLTSFGRLVLGVQLKVAKASELQWKLKAIDQIETSEDIPEEERAKLIVELVGDGNQEITNELLKSREAAKDNEPRRRHPKDRKS